MAPLGLEISEKAEELEIGKLTKVRCFNDIYAYADIILSPKKKKAYTWAKVSWGITKAMLLQ